MKEAIQKAIEGGYNGYRNPFCIECGGYESPNGQPSMLLDSLFWQALGKAEGWKKYTWTSWKGWNEHWIEYPTDEESYSPPSQNAYCQRHITFVFYWHRFIDHLAEGKDAESFFVELLKVTKE